MTAACRHARHQVAKFLLDGVKGKFGAIQQYDAARRKTRQLAAKLRADRATSTAHQYYLPIDEGVQPGFIQLHGVAAEEVIQLDRPQ